MHENEIKEILKNIELLGAVDKESAEIVYLINRNANENVVDKTNGKGRIKTHLVRKFELIDKKPLELSALSNLEIRCFNCGRIITYPALVLKKEMIKNKFYYFLCFAAEGKVSLDNCFER